MSDSEIERLREEKQRIEEALKDAESERASKAHNASVNAFRKQHSVLLKTLTDTIVKLVNALQEHNEKYDTLSMHVALTTERDTVVTFDAAKAKAVKSSNSSNSNSSNSSKKTYVADLEFLNSCELRYARNDKNAFAVFYNVSTAKYDVYELDSSDVKNVKSSYTFVKSFATLREVVDAAKAHISKKNSFNVSYNTYIRCSESVVTLYDKIKNSSEERKLILSYNERRRKAQSEARKTSSRKASARKAKAKANADAKANTDADVNADVADQSSSEDAA